MSALERLFEALAAIGAYLRRGKFSRELRGIFYQTLFLHQRGGTAKQEALTMLRDVYARHLSVSQAFLNRLNAKFFRSGRPFFRSIIVDVCEDALLRPDVPLAFAIEHWIPATERTILYASEKSGNLVQGYEICQRTVKLQSGMWLAVIAGFTYPVLQGLGVMAMLYAFATMMLPRMEGFHHSNFSPLTQSIITLSLWIRDYWWLWAAGIASLMATIMWSLGRRGPIRNALDKVPPWSFYRMVHGALFLSSFATLQRSGIPVLEALATLAESANPWLKERIEAAAYGVRQGFNIGRALRNAGHEFPDWKALPVVESFASKSRFAETLGEYADDWLLSTAKRVERNARVGFYVGVFVAACWIAAIALAFLEITTIPFT
ncbi:type II secretion system F family protein [Achromobacter aloeverae]